MLMADVVPEFYCRSWSGFSTRWVAYVDCNTDYKDKFELLGTVSINGKPYRCTGVLISVMNHRTGQQLFNGERIGLEVVRSPTRTPPQNSHPKITGYSLLGAHDGGATLVRAR